MGTKRFYYGGQAVIEGVMMRGPAEVVTCVRTPSGEIVTRREAVSAGGRRGWRGWPLVRGVFVLGESMYYGVRSLCFSSQAAGEEEAQLSDREMALTAALAAASAVGLFFLLPAVLAHGLRGVTDSPLAVDLAEGILRILLFLAYLAAIGQEAGIRRVFQYHGAEHKTIFCYEHGHPLTTSNVRRESRLHPRCGTNFLMVLMIVSVFAFAFLGWTDLWLRLLSRVVLLPLIAGISYEWLRMAAESENPIVRALNRPGMYLELLTTREPDDDQIEVAVAALRGASEPDRI